MAEALGWPAKRLGWNDLLKVAADSRRLGRVRPPRVGARSSWATPIPSSRTPGCWRCWRRPTPARARRAGCRRRTWTARRCAASSPRSRSDRPLRQVDRVLRRQMLARGPGYLSAAVLYENLVIESYAKASPRAAAGVDLPARGHVLVRPPVRMLDADWVGARERKAAEALLAFLAARPAQERALALGFRPADPAIAMAAPVDAAHGADAKQPQTLLDVPDAAALAQAAGRLAAEQEARPTWCWCSTSRAACRAAAGRGQAGRAARSSSACSRATR